MWRCSLILCCVSLVLSYNAGRTLVYVSDSDKTTYADFFSTLESYLDVTYTAGDAKVTNYGEWLFDNIVLFGVTSEGFSTNFLDFVDAGNNLLVVARPVEDAADADSAVPEFLKDLAIECGVDFTDRLVTEGGKNEVSAVVNNLKPVTGGKKFDKFKYSGISMVVEKNNPLLIPVVRATANAVTADEDDDGSQIKGEENVFVTGLQTRIGSRVGFATSANLFTANAPLMGEFTKWTFQRRGVLRARNADGTQKAKIRDQMAFSVQVEEWTGETASGWVPFKTDDLQMEFTMIDPYVRQAMKYDTKKNDGTYTLDFKAPDVYGIYKYVVDYRRTGYSPLLVSEQTTLRPLRLNEYERFIPAAYPYYASVFLAMAGFVLFSAFYMGAQ